MILIKNPGTLILFTVLICSLSLPAGANSDALNSDALKIADSTGDWGYPNPFGHYPRGPGYLRMNLIFETLVWKDENGFIPNLASEWVYDEAETAYIFTLNKNATWTDGTDFSADDVKFTFDYYKEHPYKWGDVSVVESCEVLDADMVKIKLVEPFAPFIHEMAGVIPIIPKHIWENVSDPVSFVGDEALIGTGPYILEDYNREQGSYLYRANSDYYLGTPAFEKLMYLKVSDGQTALQNGDVDLAQIEPEAVSVLEAGGFETYSSSGLFNYKLLINHEIEPFSSKKFRQALAYAIDRQEVLDKAARGYGTPGNLGLLSSSNEWYSLDQAAYEYSPEKARELLEGLGYAREDRMYVKDGKILEVEILTTPTESRTAEIVGAQLEKLGIKVTITSLDKTAKDARTKSRDFELSINGHGGVGRDPEILYEMYTENLSVNSAQYTENEELNEKLLAQLHEMDYDTRLELTAECQKLISEDVPSITLYYPNYYYGSSGKADWFITRGGIAGGFSNMDNKMCLLSREGEGISNSKTGSLGAETDTSPAGSKAGPDSSESVPFLSLSLSIAVLGIAGIIFRQRKN
ncbi:MULTISPECIES: ABC transporter substrate-binding protein [unclassified Methanosarcina]|uniref:ABC transporter substrate-binding protein n=1 Tax=unclassified Methanosarcina TaxID=2644672 RepID=UPI000616153E|nr:MULTISPECIES: ABC transporter substrate-binding protein [unclassified Methanosarcina]AKB20116.1 Oligopeptide ABC transporter, periplasmic oligopeptide-binding protein OppA [Methanosarcina sp. WWM596]AKB21684.1 Oligopeptide ABC transporter, periplasmic oligopeptide-binding protein OppA [Methanosarcina sp. WH1]